MIPSDKTFSGRQFYDDDGKKVFRWHYFKELGDYRLCFRVISSNSAFKQGFSLFFSDFQGEVKANNALLAIPKGKFGHYLFTEDDIRENGLVLDVHTERGCIFIGNSSERPELGIYTCGAFGNSFWIEAVDKSTMRFHCNDHEYDDDFDDFVFDVSYSRM